MNQLERYHHEKGEAVRLETKLAGHVAQYRAARTLQGISAAAGVVGAFWQGLPSLIIAAGAVWLFQQAVPLPDKELDDFTGRGL